MRVLVLVLLALVTWPIGYAVELLVVLSGFVVVAVLAARRAYVGGLSRLDGSPILVWAASWAKPWSNEEDGIDPIRPPTNPSGRRWWERSRGWGSFRRAYSWAALRNPASGLRWTVLAWHYRPFTVRSIGNCLNPGRAANLDPRRVFWCWASQGLKSGLWIQRGDLTILRVGWGVHAAPLREIDGHQFVKGQVLG